MASEEARRGDGDASEDDASEDAGRHEFRAGAVFYGGVSLAVYENGVARAFFDAATGAGLFGPLLDLIDTRFIVDVISGSSAGGINGLLLAAALERGFEFGETAALWRVGGGIENLLRTADQDAAESLLDGETYYLQQLRDVFHRIYCPKDAAAAESDFLKGHEPPGEIDVFVTGTDLVGATGHFIDAFGAPVQTRNHRLVFHLEHRRDRKDLGFVKQPPGSDDSALSETTAAEVEDRRLQADILAAVARITSSFPGAFPPFTVEEFAKAPGAGSTRATQVRQALQRLCGQDLSHDPELIDGGVLDNRPFGPLLDAVFHRMPFRDTRGVTRRIFYVDPDPDVFEPREAGRFKPLAVAVSSIVALPSYDSITVDIDRVAAHNARMAHREQARERVVEAATPASIDVPIYRYALERELMASLNGFDLPGPQVPGSDEQRRLAASVGSIREIKALSVGYHLRRAVSLFYPSTSSAPAVDLRTQSSMAYGVGRVVKALKLLRDVWTSELRTARKTRWPTLERRLEALRFYLAGSWVSATPIVELSAIDLDSARLSQLALGARATLRTVLQEGAPPLAHPAAPGLLELLERHLLELLGERHHELDDFGWKDASLYPLELASGTHALDEVKIIRISPNDPTLPLNDGNRISGRTKLTGDELAHFSAFLRRDFRTNDVAWGHVDGIERIVRGLLHTGACDRAMAKFKSSAAAFTTQALMSRLDAKLDDLSAPLRKTLTGALDALAQAFQRCCEGSASPSAPLPAATWDGFVDAFITAAQTAAACEYIEQIHRDALWQDSEFKWAEVPPLRVTEGSALQQLVALRRGEAPVLAAMPPSVVVEYASRAGLLLWAMVEQSLKKPQPDASEGARLARPLVRARPYIVGSLGAVHAVAALVRREERAGALLLFGVLVGSVVLMISTAFGATLKFLPLGLLGVALCVLASRIVKSMSWVRTFKTAGVLLATAGVLWVIVTTRVTVRPPWGQREYTIQLSSNEASQATEKPGLHVNEPTASK